MLALPAQIEQVRHRVTMRDQPVGDERAVTFGRIALRAHDADAALDRGQGAGRRLKFIGLHVIGVGGPHAAEGLAFPAIGDAGFFHRSLQILSVELWMTARTGVGTHVDERADAGFLEDCYELPGAASAVADREDQAVAALASFFSVFLGAFLSPFLSSPPSVWAPSAARSIKVTSASGALSPLRKPVFRIRR